MKEEKIGGLFKGVTSPMVSTANRDIVYARLISTLLRLGWYSICEFSFVVLECPSH